MTLHLKCPICGFLDIVLRENAKNWNCPNCAHQKNGWISVDDALPLHMQEIKFKGKFPFEGCGFFEKRENGYSFFYKYDQSKKIYYIYGVTHWMPKPKDEFSQRTNNEN